MSTDEAIVTRGTVQNSVIQDYDVTASPLYSLKEVSHHCDSNSCWIVLFDKIYDVTDFIYEHPGGEDFLLENAGRDATIPFKDKGHSQDALEMLSQFYIGELVENERVMHILGKRSSR